MLWAHGSGTGSHRDPELTYMRPDRCGPPLRIEAGEGKRLDVLCEGFLPCTVDADDLLCLSIIGVANVLIGIVSIAIPIEVRSDVELGGSIGDAVETRPR